MLSATPWTLADYEDTYTLESKTNETELVCQSVIDSVAAEMIQDGIELSLSPLQGSTLLGNAITASLNEVIIREPTIPDNITSYDWVRVYSEGYAASGTFSGTYSGTFAGTVKEGEAKWATGIGWYDDYVNWVGGVNLLEDIGNQSWGSLINSSLEAIGIIERTPTTVSGSMQGTLQGTLDLSLAQDGIMNNSANIGWAHVAGYGWYGNNELLGALNHNGKTIDIAVVDANGRLTSNGTTVPVNGNVATIGVAFISGDEYGVGKLTNARGAKIGVATVGQWGILTNEDGISTIGAVFVDGGMVNNAARIDNLLYISGQYTQTSTGSIGTLTVSSDSAGINWGIVDHLQFDSNGRGSITVNAPTLVNAPTFIASTDRFHATSVDLTNGNIVLDLTGQNIGTAASALHTYFNTNYASKGFKIADLFVGTDVYGINSIKSFTVKNGNDQITILGNGTNDSGWTFNKTTGTMSATSTQNSVKSVLVTNNKDDNSVGSLRQAIANAEAGDTITFAASMVGQTINLSSGELGITKNTTIDATGLGITIDAQGQSRVFNIHSGATVVLAGLTITGGGNIQYGGGIYNNSGGVLTVSDCTIIENKVTNGSGIYNTGTLTITNSTISKNPASNKGGGIYNTGTLTVTNSTISENKSMSSDGGGIWNNGTLFVTNESTISGNWAKYHGGGIYNYQGGTVTITNSTIAKNKAKGDGGGIDSWRDATVTITSSTITGNQAGGAGGGIDNRFGTLTVINTVIAGNRAETGGGGGINNDEQGTLTVRNSTIAGNLADKANGGGIWSNNITYLYNTIVACNLAGASKLPIQDVRAPGLSGNNNFIGNGIIYVIGDGIIYNVGVGIRNGSNDNIAGTYKTIFPSILVLDKLADPLFMIIPKNINESNTGLNYNAADWDLRLKDGSEAINSGNNASATGLQFDLDGKARIIGGTVDMGAYEYGNQPVRPTNLHSTAATATSVTLAWDTVTYASGYQIRYRQTGSTGAWTTVTVSGQSTTTKEVTGLLNNKSYDFQICATHAGGNSDWSLKPISATTKIKLGTPTLDTVTATHHNEISVAWTAVADVNGYMIQYATNSTFTTGVGTKTITNGSTDSTTISDLSANTTYYVRIMAIGAGNSWVADYSTSKSAKTKTKLTTPTLGTVSGTHHNEISVAWNSVSNASGYKVEWSINENFDNIAGAKNVASTSTTISGLNATTTYYVRIMATGTGNYCDSDYSDYESATTKTKLATPTLSVGTITATSAALSWNKIDNATEYVIERTANGGGTWTTAETITNGSTTSTTVSASANTSYLFRIKAIGTGTYCDSDISATEPVLTLPDAPKNFSGTPGMDSVALTWNYEPNLNGYELRYKKSTAPEWTIHTPALGASATSATISGLESNVLYNFELRAINASGKSEAATQDVTTNPDAPEPPPNFRSDDDDLTATSAMLRWDSQPNLDNYTLEYRTSTTLPWTTWATPLTDATNLPLAGLIPNTYYEFRLTAENTSGTASLQISFTTLCNVPLNLHSPSQTSSSIDLAWDAPVGGANYYRLERFDNELTEWMYVTDVASTFFTDHTLVPNTPYDYRLYAMNSAGALSATAATASVTTDRITLTVITPSTYSPQLGTKITTTLLPSGATADYQWYRGEEAIEGATDSFYTPVADDVGYLLKVVAVGTGDYKGTIERTLTNPVSPDQAWLDDFLVAHPDLTASVATWTNGRITSLNLSNKGLTGTLDVSTLTALRNLACSSNELESLNVSGCTALTYLGCASNKLTLLDVTTNTALTDLRCSSNELTRLDVSKNTALTRLECQNNELMALDMSGCIALTYLSCSYNQLTTLDVSKNAALGTLYCANNELKALDVSGCIALTYLSCHANELLTLDVSKNTSLETLSCSSNELTMLNVSKNIALADLRCYSNKLTALDVSKNTVLTRLECHSNPLKALDVSDNVELIYLSCSSAELPSLDVSNNTALETLYCGNNRLKALNVSNNVALTYLSCYSNQLLFSSLKLPSHIIDTRNYSSQAAVSISLESGNVVNLSRENVNGATEYTWYRNGGSLLTFGTHYTEVNGVFTFIGLIAGDEIYCTMTNPGYSGMTLSTTKETYVAPLTGITPSTNSPQVGTQITTTFLPAGATANYQWQRLVNSTWQNITTNGTSNSYTPVAADVGYQLRVTATGTGNYTGTTTSSPTNAAKGVLDSIILSTNSPQVGTQITITLAPGTATANYQWQRLVNSTWQNITTNGASNSYTPVAADVGYQLRVVATGIGNYTGTATSSPTNVVPTIKLTTPTLGDVLPTGSSTISVAWSMVSNASGYKVEYRVGTGAWLEAGASGNAAITTPQLSGTTWSATIGNLAANTAYAIRVAALGTGAYGDSNPSATKSATTLCNAPTNLRSDTITSTRIQLLWDAPTGGATSYRVERSANGTSGWTSIYTGNATSCTNYSPTSSTTYYYRVYAVNSVGVNSATAAENNFTTLPEADIPTITAHPQSATYTQGQTATAFSVTATAGNGTLTYQWFATGSSTVLSTSQTYTPSTTTVGSAGYYCVVTNTLNGTSESATSNIATIMVNAEIPPDTFTVTSDAKSLTISWTTAPPAGSVFQYRQGSNWITWKGQTAGSSIQMSGLKAGTYDVRLVDKQGGVIDTKTETVNPSGSASYVPQKPKVSLDKTVNKPTISTVTLKITPPKKATNESNVRYVIDIVKVGKANGRPSGFTPFTVTATYLAQNSNRVLVDGLNPNTSYKVSITAINASGDSVTGKGKSVVVNVTAKTKAYAAPTGIKKTVTSNSITLTWKASPFPETTHYEIRNALTGALLATVPATGTTGKVSWTYDNDGFGLYSSTTYKFTICAVSDTLDGLKSKVAKVSAKTKKV